MTTITTKKRELKTIIKESVREVLSQELMQLRALMMPLVSSKEQKDIERRYKKPSRKAAKTLEMQL